MSTYKSTGTPELVPYTPIYISGKKFDPSVCIHDIDPDNPHVCAHDWRVFWGNQSRPL